MAKLKFKPRTHILLSIIADVSTLADDGRYAIFDNGDTRRGTWCKALGLFVQVSAGDGHVLRALARHGYTKQITSQQYLRYAFRITEAGQAINAEWLKTIPKSQAEREAYQYLKQCPTLPLN